MAGFHLFIFSRPGDQSLLPVLPILTSWWQFLLKPRLARLSLPQGWVHSWLSADGQVCARNLNSDRTGWLESPFFLSSSSTSCPPCRLLSIFSDFKATARLGHSRPNLFHNPFPTDMSLHGKTYGGRFYRLRHICF
ncbi:hypothetical protein A6X21_01645 [Planctopirus hydrillae]|uniref:Uncharacterized protein n=1 Tax=Planctopirus hydrillae TaxID=1841610 RepID=A0A1C3EU24_9PLAN|nr:hypothetical protein A6X21_01645 [Planctopirus hydrillae]